MKFQDLLELPFDNRSGKIEARAILDLLPTTPMEVVEQVLSDHGRNGDFQRQYADLELSRITWSACSLDAATLSSVSIYPRFEKWVRMVADRAGGFPSKKWKAIDCRRKIQEHWQAFGTWMVPPVLLRHRSLGIDTRLHLVEGHTRIGTLIGLVEAGVLQPDSMHTVWLGSVD